MSRRFRNWFLCLSSTALAIVLIILLLRTQDITVAVFVEQLLAISGLALLLFFATRTLFVMIASFRWFLILRAMKVSSVSYRFCLMSISSSLAMAAFLPQQISFVLVRTIMAKKSGYTSLKGGGFSVIYDIAYNFYCSLLLVPASVLLFSGHTRSAVLVLLICLSLGMVLPTLAVSKFVSVLLLGYEALRKMKFFAHRLPDLPHESSGVFFSRGNIMALLTLALLQNFTLIFSCYIYAVGSSVEASFGAILATYPLLYFGGLIGLTPGNLGVLEWTWTGSLVAMGTPSSQAAAFALGLRVVGLGVNLLIAAFFIMVPAVWGNKDRKNVEA